MSNITQIIKVKAKQLLLLHNESLRLVMSCNRPFIAVLCDAALIYYASFYFEVFPNERRDSFFPSETKRGSFSFRFIVQGLETVMRSWLLITEL